MCKWETMKCLQGSSEQHERQKLFWRHISGSSNFNTLVIANANISYCIDLH